MSPYLKIFLRMPAYGFGLGFSAGALSLFTIALMRANDYGFGITIGGLVGGIVWSIVFGGMIGGMYGTIAGFASGSIMVGVSYMAFRVVQTPRIYKLVMGIITCAATLFVFLDGELMTLLSYIQPETADMSAVAVMLMSVVIAVYASQITARKYIHEISIRKQKVHV